MSTANIYFASQLPWSSSTKENRIFGAITLIVLVSTLLLASFVWMTDLPEIPREQREQVPPQLAQIIQAQTPPPPPPQIEPEPEPEPEIEPEIEPEPIEPVPETVIEPEAETLPPPEPEKVEFSEQEKVIQARETAKSKGVLAFADTLASMREQTNLNNLANTQLSEGGGEAEVTQRDIIAAPSLEGSGGIQTGNLSSDVGAAGELEGRRNTEFVAASQGEAALATKRVETQQQVIGSRDLDQIRQTLDANKGSVYSLYRRALREDPSIEGKLTVRLTIEPDGSLSSVTLVDSELEAPELVQRLITRIGLINFGAANVTPTELEYSYNFLPF
jgi:outer membrane biosynthesis protein TonB